MIVASSDESPDKAMTIALLINFMDDLEEEDHIHESYDYKHMRCDPLQFTKYIYFPETNRSIQLLTEDYCSQVLRFLNKNYTNF